MKGQLIVIESGTDASGKATQSGLLYQRLKEKGYRIHLVQYPDYKSESSALVKMYLQGEFGENPEDVNSYAASTFFAVDRFASFRKEWNELYQQGYIIIADRYTTSNMVHQASKIRNLREREEFLNWLWDLEFNKFELPVPDKVIFLDMPPENSSILLRGRINKMKDIHEKDRQYMKETYENALQIARDYNWEIIKCLKDGELGSIDEIHEDIYRAVINFLKGSD
jgi:dTMP kinase